MLAVVTDVSGPRRGEDETFIWSSAEINEENVENSKISTYQLCSNAAGLPG